MIVWVLMKFLLHSKIFFMPLKLKTKVFLIFWIGSCQSSIIKPKDTTKLPVGYEYNTDRLNSMGLFDGSFFNNVITTRNNVEMRHGPGVRFDLKDKIYPKDTIGIVTESIGNWVKFIPVGGGITGWIHAKTVRSYNQTEKITMSFRKLPIVTAVHRVTKVFDYKSLEKFATIIPKGTAFVALKKHKWRLLVWIPQTNSLAWVSQRDFR